MKYQNIIVYSVLAIGLLSIPSLLDSIYAQTNATQQNQTAGQQQQGQNQTAGQQQQGQNQTAGQQQQGQTLSPDTQALTTLDIPELKDNLMAAKDAVANGNTEEALTLVSEVETDLLTLQPAPKFTGDFQKIKDSLGKADLAKALDDISKVQTEVLKAETEIQKSGLPTPQQLAQQNAGNGDGGEDGEDGEDGEN
jgi:hypothetical protein